jgi:hypothetical protein
MENAACTLRHLGFQRYSLATGGIEVNGGRRATGFFS